MEKLKNLRKQRGYTQDYMSKIISTDVSNYCRKENGEVKIYDEEWEKLAKALDVSVEEIKESRTSELVQNNDNNGATFNDHAGNFQSTNYTYCNIPEYILENQQEYIKLLKEQIESLKQEVKSLTSKK
ncbi:XRE family transcriptional regulator [Chryseobacterium sp. G0186]|uniref:helix-turn-helix domain-containing protein n=1 Tax=Chryseobacterium sp. G0186 TaxID=2487064 RepID=UPI000F516B3D|nr:helix-turn-helix transcriptional regulator [Chryseobacterium sp. G0186]AZA77326.1 XRE family transcriptional regulator [Chryseobacterium sp. G0186]